ncbi:P-loop NTPase fold protein, partial [Klebsiella pneumoniae]
MNITKVLDDFLQSEDRVAVIKGEWGVGKTYFWNK